MVTINKKPDALSFSGNLKEFVLTSINLVRFKLKQGTTLLLDQSYEPGENNLITIDVSSVIESCLTFHLREGELHYEQSDIASDFTADIDGTEHPFRVLRGGIRNLADTPANWLTQHFLTWQPTQKKVTYYSPEWLTYYAVSNCSIVLKAYFDDKSTQELTLLNCLAGHAYTVNTQYAVIAGLLSNKLPMYYDVYAATGSTRLSEIQRYLASAPLSSDEQWISWENSLGGYDTARVYGITTLNAEHTHNIAQLGDTAEEYDIETERKYTKNTGHLSTYERHWFLDFFPAKAKYIYSDNAIRKIVVLEDSVSYKSNELPSSYTFTYKFAQSKPYLNLQRNPSELPAGITIPIPSLPDFTLPPRLSEYPRIPLAEGVLFPVHDPHSDSLGATTFGAIMAAILAAVEDASIGNANYEILKTWIRENFLSKINKDKARDVITFLQGLVAQGTSRFTHAQIARLNVDNITEFGDNVPGYTGGYINREGEAELKSLILRTFLAVPEIRFNRTTVFKGRNWITPGGGCVLEEVSGLANNTYFCKPKLEEGEPLSFANDDILEAFWHDKNVQTGAIKGFQQMHFRVASADYDERTFILVPRNEVSVAHPFMNLAQYGNFTNPERQTSILLDSTYGNNCILFLEGVNSWDITPSMEKSWLGKRKGRTVAGINMDNYSGKLQNIVFSGKLFQVDDVTGDDIRVPLDKGAWQENTRYAYYDRVSYAGSLWLCVNEAGTTNAPSQNEPDWLLQVSEGKPGEGFTPQGLWDKYTTYKKGDVVSYNGNSFVYISSTPSAGTIPLLYPGGYIKSGTRQVVSGGQKVYTGNPGHPWLLLAQAGKDGEPGHDGVPGEKGADGIQYYTWIKFADDAQGNGMSNSPKGKNYLGIAVNKLSPVESDNPSDYHWQYTKGEQGTDGIPGKPGADGATSYFHIKYSPNPDGNPMTETPSTYIGTYVDFTKADSEDYHSYTWHRFEGIQGEKGEQGIPGIGIDGKTSYLHIKYSNDNGTTFTSHNGETPGDYIGQYTDFEINDSRDVTHYTWSLIKGPQGIPGTPGADGKPTYTWVKYADDNQGSGISDYPDGKKYIGFAYNKNTEEESTNPADYRWSKIEGDKGDKGDGFEAKGKWSQYTTYKKGDVISHNGDSYVYTAENPAAGITPLKHPGGYILSGGRQVISGGQKVYTGNPNHPWLLLAEAGKNGVNGADGVAGKDGVSIVWQGEFSTHPANPQSGWAYKNTTDKKSYVYQSGAWYQMTVDGIDGANGKDGLSITWKGELKNPPANPEKNWAYRDTDNGVVYIYNGTAWAVMVADGSDGADGAPGTDGKSVYVTYNDSPTQPALPTGNGTTGGWHTNTTPTAIWISQKIASGPEDGVWGTPIKIKGEIGMTPRGDWNMTTNYIVGDMVKFAKCTWIAKVANVGIPPVALLKTGGKFVKSGGKYITRGSYKLYSNNTTWTLFTEPQELPAIEHEYTAYHTSPTKPAKPIYTGNSQGWVCNGTVPSGARWKSTKKATTPASGTWSDVVIYAPVDGTPGTDATAYWLTSSVTSIVFNSLGTPTPEAFLVNCKKQTGDRSVEACTDLYLAARKSANGTDYTSHVAPVKAASINISVLTGIKSYAIRIYKNQADAQAWNSNFIDELGVSVVSDGQRGATGSMPRNCGAWLSAETYVWTEGYRDIIFYPFAGVNYQFAVKAYGASLKNVPPTSANGDANWEVANKFKFIATDTLLADGANIAGFMYKDNKMQSQRLINQVAAILLDGIHGNGHFAGGNFRFTENGDIDITGIFRTSLGGNRVVISPEGEGSSIKLMNKQGLTLLNIFFDKEDGYENYFPSIHLSYLNEEVKIGKNGIRIYNSSGWSDLRADSLKIYQNVSSGGYKLVAHLP